MSVISLYSSRKNVLIEFVSWLDDATARYDGPGAVGSNVHTTAELKRTVQLSGG
jgi:hypothetical protein